MVFAIHATAFAIGIPFNSYAASILWGWFFVPIGLPAIGIAHAFGVQMTLKYLTMQSNVTTTMDDKPPVEKALNSLFLAVFKPLVYLAAGYAAKLIMGTI